METVFVVLVLAVSVGAVIFYLGASYGTTVQQLAVAKALAEYSIVDGAARDAVSKILRALHYHYTLAYNEVIDEVHQAEIDLKRSVHGG